MYANFILIIINISDLLSIFIYKFIELYIVLAFNEDIFYEDKYIEPSAVAAHYSKRGDYYRKRNSAYQLYDEEYRREHNFKRISRPKKRPGFAYRMFRVFLISATMCLMHYINAILP